MTKTLDKYPPEQREQMIGMWCDNLISTAKEPDPVVLACVQGDLCWVLHTNLHGEWSCFPLDGVSPRFDLPRVWTPDGEPVKGVWSEGYAYANDECMTIECYETGSLSDIDDEQWSKFVTVTDAGEHEATGTARRFITEWEQVPNE